MAETYYVLTDSERKLLQRLLDNDRRRIQNTTGRAALGGEDYLTPEMYIAKTFSDGIPAMEEVGTGTGTSTCNFEEPIPGSANCHIFQLATESIPHRLMPLTYSIQRVYNRSTTAVAGCSFVIIQRDKYGIWWVTEGSGESIEDGFFIEITDWNTGTKALSWRKVTPIGDGLFAPHPDGESGTFSFASAFEQAGNPTVPIGEIVWSKPGVDYGGGDEERVFACPSRIQMVRLDTSPYTGTGTGTDSYIAVDFGDTNASDAWVQRYDTITHQWVDVERVILLTTCEDTTGTGGDVVDLCGFSPSCMLYADGDGCIACMDNVFWDNTNHRMVLGHTSSLSNRDLEIVHDSTHASLQLTSFSGRGFLILQRANGTLASPTIVADGNQLGVIQANAYNGSSYSSTVAIVLLVDGTVTSGQTPPTSISFHTTLANGSQVERMRIGPAGVITVTNNILLDVDSAGSLGSVNKRWANLYVSGTSNLTGTTNIGEVGSAGTLKVYNNVSGGTGAYGYITMPASDTLLISSGQGSAATGNIVQIGSVLYPSVDNALALGSSSLRWGSMWIGTGASNFAGGLVLTNSSAPGGGTDKCELYSTDQVAGNACIHTQTENGAIIKLFQAAAIADLAGGASLADVITKINVILAMLRANGLIAT